MINSHNLKLCMHKVGDKQPDVIGIKRFLNFSCKVKVSDIKFNAYFPVK